MDDQKYYEAMDFCRKYQLRAFRVDDQKIRIHDLIDIYPQSRKYCRITDRKWGSYDRLDYLLKYFFNEFNF